MDYDGANAKYVLYNQFIFFVIHFEHPILVDLLTLISFLGC